MKLALTVALALTLSALATWLLLRAGTSPDCDNGYLYVDGEAVGIG